MHMRKRIRVRNRNTIGSKVPLTTPGFRETILGPNGEQINVTSHGSGHPPPKRRPRMDRDIPIEWDYW